MCCDRPEGGGHHRDRQDRERRIAWPFTPGTMAIQPCRLLKSSRTIVNVQPDISRVMDRSNAHAFELAGCMELSFQPRLMG